MTTAQVGRRSSASSVTSFDEAARLLNVRLCVGPECDLSPRSHSRGTARRNVVHWSPRRFTKLGFWTFLKLVATATYGQAREHHGPPFVRIYWQNVLAARYGRSLGVRFPREYADTDRARVRFWLARWRPTAFDNEFPEQRQLLRRIAQWARTST